MDFRRRKYLAKILELCHWRYWWRSFQCLCYWNNCLLIGCLLGVWGTFHLYGSYFESALIEEVQSPTAYKWARGKESLIQCHQSDSLQSNSHWSSASFQFLFSEETERLPWKLSRSSFLRQSASWSCSLYSRRWNRLLLFTSIVSQQILLQTCSQATSWVAKSNRYYSGLLSSFGACFK